MAMHSATGIFPSVSFKQFRHLEILVGKVMSANVNKNAKIPAYLIEISFGHQLDAAHQAAVHKPYFKSSAQLCSNHSIEDIQGNLLMSVVNFPRKQIGSFKSDCLITGAQKELGSPDQKRATTVFLRPTHEVPAGSRIGVNGDDETIENLERNLEWNDFIQVDLRIGTIVSFVFEEIRKDFGRLEGKVLFSEGDQTRHFIGLVHKDLVADLHEHNQLMFWANPLAEDIQANPSMQGFMQDSVLLCTLNGGRAGIETAKKVDDGFRIA